MTPKHVHFLKLTTLAATLWALDLVPWNPILWLEPFKPTLLSIAFGVLAHRFREMRFTARVPTGRPPFTDALLILYIEAAAGYLRPALRNHRRKRLSVEA
jgi:hypothetical protein